MTGRRSASRSVLAAVGVAALLALTGCSVGLEGQSSEVTRTLTPAPVPDGREGVSSPRGAADDGGRIDIGGPLVPGLRPEGVTNASALARAHRAYLDGRSFTRAHTRTLTDANGTLLVTRTELHVAAGGTPLRVSKGGVAAARYEGGEPRRVDIYHDGDRAAARVVYNGSVTYYAEDTAPVASVADDPTGRRAVVRLLTAAEWKVTRLETTGNTYYRLESTTVTRPAALDVPPSLSDVRNVEARVLVGPREHVSRYRLTYHATRDGRPVGVTVTMRWLRIGETTVAPPDWLERAREIDRDG